MDAKHGIILLSILGKYIWDQREALVHALFEPYWLIAKPA